MKAIIFLVFLLSYGHAFANQPTLANLMPGTYECTNNNMIIEITNDREILFEVPRNNVATDLMLDKIGFARSSTLVKGHLSSPPKGYQSFHALAIEQNTEMYGTTVSVRKMLSNVIFIRIPTIDFGEFLGKYESSRCDLIK